MVCTYNEEDWIEPSLLSIKELVNEYVVIDSSTDNTPKIIKKLQEKYDLPIRLFRVKAGDLVLARNLALKEAKFKWVLHWDADFIAKPELISVVKKLINELDKNKHYLIYWYMIRLCGDLRHVCRDVYHIEHWLFTWSHKLRYEWVDKYDSLIAPLYMYKVIYIPKPLGIHLAYVRRPERLFVKWIWWRYRREADKYAKEGGTLEEFALTKAKELYGISSLREAGKRIIEDMTSTLPLYNEAEFGRYPDLLIKRARELGLI